MVQDDGERRQAALGRELRIAVGRTARRLRRERGEADLPEGQFMVLAVLSLHGPLTPGALAEHERVRPPSMTRAVNALVTLGMVEKDEHPTDGRQVVVRLTEKGAAEVHETRRRREEWLEAQLAGLTAQERQTLAQACELLSRIAAR